MGDMGEITTTDEGRGPNEQPYGDLELEALAPDMGPPPRTTPDVTLVLRLSDVEAARAGITPATSSAGD